MNIQNFINKGVNWYYRDDIAKIDQEYKDLVNGRQFPDEDKVLEGLEKVSNYPGPKISTDSYVSDNELSEILGALNNTSED